MEGLTVLYCTAQTASRATAVIVRTPSNQPEGLKTSQRTLDGHEHIVIHDVYCLPSFPLFLPITGDQLTFLRKEED